MRNPTLRQLEALIAVVETGTVSRAAEILSITQSGASKLIQDLEADTGMQLFERGSGRLVPTNRGMLLYEEVERIFGGIHQLARTVEFVRRQEHGRLAIGTLPALSGSFMSRVLVAFAARHPEVFASVEARSSQYLCDAVLTRRLDVAFVVNGFEHPTLIAESFNSPDLVALLPLGHPLQEKTVIRPSDLANERFISFAPSSRTRLKVDAAFEAEGISPRTVFEATTSPNVAEFVASGLGVTVADPLAMESVCGRVAVRRFSPSLTVRYQIIRPIRARSSSLVTDLIGEVHSAARNSILKP
ncbi:LysR family transcriptional regulator [Agrobacterium tumefaciens]|uniref:LysR substrate-binding domain-containing protein n=1 Tax=Agrobacterium tumefaciens TaxID=358 RepID=UPI0015725905|nr:LysR substrate-binding domain-containing protein [Agrobacterium tumefaciens]NSX84365.1 LysR family transcriptional regulator [Agrobacterium tumefaciens]NTA50000.1 LysR family transcriptional regulator [Agrobacterium tumefaciens]